MKEMTKHLIVTVTPMHNEMRAQNSASSLAYLENHVRLGNKIKRKILMRLEPGTIEALLALFYS